MCGRQVEMSEKLGVMLCGHGSRDADAVREFAVLSEHLKRRLPQYPVEYGSKRFSQGVFSEDEVPRIKAPRYSFLSISFVTSGM